MSGPYLKWAAVELRWDGAPPLPNVLRVAVRDLLSLDSGYIYRPQSSMLLTADDVGDAGARFEWYKHGDRMREIAPTVGYHHPCKVRWQTFGSLEHERGTEEAWELLKTTPWILSRTLGSPDAAGRVGRHPGGRKGYGRAR